MTDLALSVVLLMVRRLQSLWVAGIKSQISDNRITLVTVYVSYIYIYALCLLVCISYILYYMYLFTCYLTQKHVHET